MSNLKMLNPLLSSFIENKGQKSWSECCNRHLYFVSIFVSIFYLNFSFLWFFFSVVTHICTGPNRRRHWTGCFGLIWGSIHRNVLQPLTALMLTNAYFGMEKRHIIWTPNQNSFPCIFLHFYNLGLKSKVLRKKSENK